MSSKNCKELKEIGSTLCQICTVLKKPALLEGFKKADFAKLDRKLFSEMMYFLLDINAPDLVKNQLEPVVNKSKPHGMFLKEAFQIVGLIKERFPWSSTILGTFQKSHFRDPRPEHDKVVDFLKKLLSVTLYVVSGAEPGQKSAAELNSEIENYEKEMEELRERKRLSDIQLKESQERLLKAEAEFKTNEVVLREKGIIPMGEPCDRKTLLKYIHIAEGKLLQKIDARLENIK